MNLFNILLLYFKACEDKTLLYTFLIPHANTDIHYNCMIPCYVNVKKKPSKYKSLMSRIYLEKIRHPKIQYYCMFVSY